MQKILVASLLLFLVNYSFGQHQKNIKKKKMDTIETIQLKMGEEKVLTFKSLATAGYTWQFTMDKPDFIGIERLEPVKTDSNQLVGASVDEVFRLKAAKKGNILLVFSQSRVWEKGIKPVKTKKYNIVIIR